MKEHLTVMADYNAWANRRLYRMAAALPDEAYRRDTGAYFASLHATLNHLLATDRIGMRRLTGRGDAPASAVIPFWRICKRLGHSPWLSLLVLVPLVNLIFIYWLAFGDWPSQRGTPTATP